VSPLGRVLARQIAAGGPITVADYMAACLTHPEHGYYVGRDPLGKAGISPPRRRSARCSAN
jgi:NADH dehydrogenase [ubiquinone] 1 alpha subcomplex assembly factor 7